MNDDFVVGVGKSVNAEENERELKIGEPRKQAQAGRAYLGILLPSGCRLSSFSQPNTTSEVDMKTSLKLVTLTGLLSVGGLTSCSQNYVDTPTATTPAADPTAQPTSPTVNVPVTEGNPSPGESDFTINSPILDNGKQYISIYGSSTKKIDGSNVIKLQMYPGSEIKIYDTANQMIWMGISMPSNAVLNSQGLTESGFNTVDQYSTAAMLIIKGLGIPNDEFVKHQLFAKLYNSREVRELGDAIVKIVGGTSLKSNSLESAPQRLFNSAEFEAKVRATNPVTQAIIQAYTPKYGGGVMRNPPNTPYLIEHDRNVDYFWSVDQSKQEATVEWRNEQFNPLQYKQVPRDLSIGIYKINAGDFYNPIDAKEYFYTSGLNSDVKLIKRIYLPRSERFDEITTKIKTALDALKFNVSKAVEVFKDEENVPFNYEKDSLYAVVITNCQGYYIEGINHSNPVILDNISQACSDYSIAMKLDANDILSLAPDLLSLNEAGEATEKVGVKLGQLLDKTAFEANKIAKQNILNHKTWDYADTLSIMAITASNAKEDLVGSAMEMAGYSWNTVLTKVGLFVEVPRLTYKAAATSPWIGVEKYGPAAEIQLLEFGNPQWKLNMAKLNFTLNGKTVPDGVTIKARRISNSDAPYEVWVRTNPGYLKAGTYTFELDLNDQKTAKSYLEKVVINEKESYNLDFKTSTSMLPPPPTPPANSISTFTITPPAQIFADKLSTPFKAVFSDGKIIPLEWTVIDNLTGISATPDKVQIVPDQAAGTAQIWFRDRGSYTVMARSTGDSGSSSATVTVNVLEATQPAMANILVKCPVAMLAPGERTTCTATAVDSTGAPLPEQPTGFKFTSSNTAAFTVDPDTGVVTATNVGMSAEAKIGATLQHYPWQLITSTLPAPLQLVATPSATDGTVNGVRIIDNANYQLGFTPLNGTQIAKDAQITGVTLRTISAGTAIATVCGQVQTQDKITTTLLLDSTGSMSTTDPINLRNGAAKTFVGRMGADDRVAVASFDSYTSPTPGYNAVRIWQDFTNDKTLLNTGIDKATFAGGGTPLYTAVIDASNMAKATGSPKPSVLVLTDGDDTGGASLSSAISAAIANGTTVYAIGLDSRNTLSFSGLQQLVSSTGGLFQKANDAAQLQAFFDKVYNAFTAQGCVQISFTQMPPSGTVVKGVIDVVVQTPGSAPSTVPVEFTLTIK